jgi:hypothetical protein
LEKSKNLKKTYFYPKKQNSVLAKHLRIGSPTLI